MCIWKDLAKGPNFLVHMDVFIGVSVLIIFYVHLDLGGHNFLGPATQTKW